MIVPSHASAAPASFPFLWLFRPTKSEIDVAARPKDGLVVFSVMWGMAMMLSVSSLTRTLGGHSGIALAAITWGALVTAGLLMMNPRKTALLALLAALMITQYLLRLPVIGNNQTIAFFMNTGILVALAAQALQNKTRGGRRDSIYEQVRVIARALLAIMYFYGIFHKINLDFLNPAVSCASALYQPLTRPFGLHDSTLGMYGAIAATFIVETIAIVCLYWRRFFWVGILVTLPFHYVIPISGYSWYMDFSSLVFALYMLSVPREVASGLYSSGVALVRRLPRLRPGVSALLALGAALLMASAIVIALSNFFPGRGERYLWHSVWLLVWAVFGGVAMVLIVRAALLELPYRDQEMRVSQPWWVYAIPTILFVNCMSPYIGLKTESSIAMFSNLHTEGGVSNHLLFRRPPYLFNYQSRAARIIDSSEPEIREVAKGGNYGMVEHDIALRLAYDPQRWITYEIQGQRYERVTDATFSGERPTWIESKLLAFKYIDWARPKVCTH